MAEFNIGDRVVSLVDHPDDNEDILEGDLGTICSLKFIYSGRICVRWDNRISGGHSCGDTCEHGYGWNVDFCDIELYKDEDVEVISDESFLKIVTKA